VNSNSIFYDGKAEACAAEFPTAPFVDTVETLKKVFQMFWFYAWAIVAHLELIEMAPFVLHLVADDCDV
jgi:predicted oxidoreductase